MEAQRRHYEAQGLTAEQLQRVMEPMECFRYDLQGQIENSKQHKPDEQKP